MPDASVLDPDASRALSVRSFFKEGRSLMATVTRLKAVEAESARDTAGIGGHPRGLTTLFFTELWERFSYYGMRAILVLYMVAPAAEGGLGLDTQRAASIYGTYTMAAYLTAIPGGYVADRFLGARLAVL